MWALPELIVGDRLSGLGEAKDESLIGSSHD